MPDVDSENKELFPLTEEAVRINLQHLTKGLIFYVIHLSVMQQIVLLYYLNNR